MCVCLYPVLRGNTPRVVALAVQRGQRAQPGLIWRLKIQGRLRTDHRLGLDSSAVTEGGPGLLSQGCCCLSETEEFWTGPLCQPKAQPSQSTAVH